MECLNFAILQYFKELPFWNCAITLCKNNLRHPVWQSWCCCHPFFISNFFNSTSANVEFNTRNVNLRLLITQVFEALKWPIVWRCHIHWIFWAPSFPFKVYRVQYFTKTFRHDMSFFTYESPMWIHIQNSYITIDWVKHHAHQRN